MKIAQTYITNGNMTNGFSSMKVKTMFEFEWILNRYVLNCENLPKEDFAEDAKLPFSLIIVFYGLFFELGVPPTQNGFINQCMDMDKMWTNINCDTEYKYWAFAGRYARTYASLIREHHFFLRCYESGLFRNISYDSYEDMHFSTDIKIPYNSKVFAVQLFTDTKKGWENFYRKSGKQKNAEIDFYIPMAIDLNKAYMVGNYKLYTPDHVHQLKNTMKLKFKPNDLPSI